MYKDLEGKVAVITGSSKGIGQSIAKRLVQEKMAVVLNYHSDEIDTEETVKEIIAHGGKAVGVKADVSTEAGVQLLLDTAQESFHRMDVWINNAGMEKQQATHQVSLEEWEKVIKLNLNGTFLGTKMALNFFLKNKIQGNILNISSVHEKIPWPTFASYTASKGGIKLFTQTTAMEYANRGIRINGIAPGAIKTAMNKNKLDNSNERETLLDMIPLKKIGDPEDIAADSSWLISDEAKYVTGITLFVDGGMSLYPAFQNGKG